MKSISSMCLIFIIFLAGCGVAEIADLSVPTGEAPFVNRTVPTTATTGDQVTIFGYGFSVVPELNVVVVGGVEVFADSYSLVSPQIANEVEKITFTVPNGVSLGSQSIYLIVVDSVSNTNITLTVN